MTKLLFVVLHEGQPSLEATVEDDDRRRRRIDIRWMVKGEAPLPDNWWDTVLGEVEVQRTEDARKKSGRILF